MDLQCECSATANGSARITTIIDRFPSIGLLTVFAEICQQDCTPESSFINITYEDDNNPGNNFMFHSSVVGLPIFNHVSGGGHAIILSAQGEAIGENINGDAVLSNIQFFEGTIIGTIICAIRITANGHTFEADGCFKSTIIINLF
ncbi:MAG: hypothetical protein K0Q87_4369 [Neobacillus sp.]|jgi:hypothetical protein|nr:hypothetical protein [Neobacillus sp.]